MGYFNVDLHATCDHGVSGLGMSIYLGPLLILDLYLIAKSAVHREMLQKLPENEPRGQIRRGFRKRGET